MNLFISQPMRGKTDDEIIAERKRIKDKVQNCYDDEVKVIDSFAYGVGDMLPAVLLLGKSIQCMNDADLVYFAKGWREARGCKIEHDVAIAYGFKTYSE